MSEVALVASSLPKVFINETGHGHSHDEDEGTGRTILYSLILVMLATQVGVFQWRQRHPKSYNLATLAALWLFPIGFQLFGKGLWEALYTPFIYIWTLFTLLMGGLLAAVHARTLAEATPGVVYGILEFIYLQCMGVASTVMTACVFLFIAPPIAAALPQTALSLLVFSGAYAVYFAVLVRDMTGVISDVLVARVTAARTLRRTGEGATGAGSAGTGAGAGAGAHNSYSHSHTPDAAAFRDACALCAGKLSIVDEGSIVEEGGDTTDALLSQPRYVRRADGTIALVSSLRPAPLVPRIQGEPATLRFASADGKTLMFQLTCKHVFHRTCLAGWAVVGKKGVCPVCSERVDITAIYADSPLLGKTSALFGQLLEMARYLVVWNPLLFFGLRLVLRSLGTLDVIEKHAKVVAATHAALAAQQHAAVLSLRAALEANAANASN